MDILIEYFFIPIILFIRPVLVVDVDQTSTVNAVVKRIKKNLFSPVPLWPECSTIWPPACLFLVCNNNNKIYVVVVQEAAPAIGCEARARYRPRFPTTKILRSYDGRVRHYSSYYCIRASIFPRSLIPPPPYKILLKNYRPETTTTKFVLHGDRGRCI